MRGWIPIEQKCASAMRFPSGEYHVTI
jgi:hypothetical protein